MGDHKKQVSPEVIFISEEILNTITLMGRVALDFSIGMYLAHLDRNVSIFINQNIFHHYSRTHEQGIGQIVVLQSRLG